MKKRILTLFCVLAFGVLLSVCVFGGTTYVTDYQSGEYTLQGNSAGSNPFVIGTLYFDADKSFLPVKVRVLTQDSSIYLNYYDASDQRTRLELDRDYILYINRLVTSQGNFSGGGLRQVTFSLTFLFPSVSPSLSNPVSVGSYSVSGLYSSPVGSEMYPNPSWGSSVFAFSSVTAPTGTTVKAHTSSGNVTVGTLANGFSFRSSDYPTADYFFIDNQTTTPASYTVAVSAINFGVSPAFTNPIQPGEYDVTDLIGTQTTNRMYTVRDDPKTFTFTDVTANASTVVSYAIASEGGTISYHNIGTLTEGFTFSSADYPVASFFTVRNTGSSLASYTVTVENDSFEKSQGIAKSIWETCLSMGTSLINWLKTPANWIALLPLVMFIVVGAVLVIRKLIKGV